MTEFEEFKPQEPGDGMGRGLRQAGAPVGRWTPFEPNVVWRLERAEP